MGKKKEKFVKEAGDVLMGGVTSPNTFKFARKLVKSQPCCKRVGHSIFYDLSFFTNNSLSIGQNAPPHIGKCLGVSLIRWKYVI